MAYTRVWSNARASDATIAKDIDDKINQLSEDISERMADVIGTSAWGAGTDPVAAADRSLTALKTAVDTKPSINATNNVIPKRSSASALANSSIADDGTTVTIGNPVSLSGKLTSAVQARFYAYRTTTQNIAGGTVGYQVRFDTGTYFNVGSAWVSPDAAAITADLAGLWLVGYTLTPQDNGTGYAWGGLRVRIICSGGGVSVDPIGLNVASSGLYDAAPTAQYGLTAACLVNALAGDGIAVELDNMHGSAALVISRAEFWGVRLF